MFLNYNNETNKFKGFIPNFIKNSIKVSEEAYTKLLANTKDVFVDIDHIIKNDIDEVTMENFDNVIIIKEPDFPTPKEEILPQTKQVMEQVAQNQITLMQQSQQLTQAAEMNKVVAGQVADEQLATAKQGELNKSVMAEVAQSQLANMNNANAVAGQENTIKMLLQQLAQAQLANIQMSKELSSAQSTNKLLAAQQASLMLQMMELKKGGQ